MVRHLMVNLLISEAMKARASEDPATRSITILAVSAYSVAGDKERIRQAGCDGFIPKPIDTRTFLQTISTFLGRRQA